MDLLSANTLVKTKIKNNMKHLKLFEDFNESSQQNSGKYVMLIWSKMVDGYPEKTGCIIDINNSIVQLFDRLFDQKTGEYTKEVEEAKKKFKIKGNLMGKKQDTYFVGEVDGRGIPKKVLTPEDAVKDFKEQMDSEKRISDYLTPERTKELINIFKNKKI